MLIITRVLVLGSASPSQLRKFAAPFGATIHPNLSYERVASELSGVIALAPIGRGELLASVPLEACLYTTRHRDDDVVLAQLLLDAAADSGRWSEYRAKILPPWTGAAMFWEEAEAEELQWPQAVALARALRMRMASRTGGVYSAKSRNRDEMRWALSIVYSRSFAVEDADDESEAVRCLAPVLDLFNHVPESPVEYAARWAEQEEEDDPPASPWRLMGSQVELLAYEDVAAGDEVRIPYGIECSHETLVQSGFIPEPNSADYVPLFSDIRALARHASAAFGLEPAQEQRRLRLLEALDAVDAPLAVRPGPLAASGHLLACTRLFAASDAELEGEGEGEGAIAFKEDYDPAVGHHTLCVRGATEEQRMQLDSAACELLAHAADECLGALPTTAEEDAMLLAQIAVDVEERVGAVEALIVKQAQGTSTSATEPQEGRIDCRIAAAAAAPAEAARRFETAVRYRRMAKLLVAGFAEQCRSVVSGVSSMT